MGLKAPYGAGVWNQPPPPRRAGLLPDLTGKPALGKYKGDD